MIQLSSAALLFTLLAGTASADMTIDQILSDKVNRSFVLDVIRAQADGISWANTYLDVTRHEPLFCQPGKLAITPEQYLDIASRYVREHPSDAQKPANSLGLILILSLIEAFPCK